RAAGPPRPQPVDGRPTPQLHRPDTDVPRALVRGEPHAAHRRRVPERTRADHPARTPREAGPRPAATREPQGYDSLERRLRHRPPALPLGERHHPPPGPLRRRGTRLMLQPDTSVLLTDALRPPPGHEVDVAVTTTYSLNLTAMLIAPMTFAFAQMDDSSGVTDRDPAQLLDA